VNKHDHKPDAKPEGRRGKKRAAPSPQPQPVHSDLLTNEVAPSLEEATAAAAAPTLPAEVSADPTPSFPSSSLGKWIQKEGAETPLAAVANPIVNLAAQPVAKPVASPSPVAEQDAPRPALPEGSAGALLKAAREAAGFSIDDASRLLKLAPRQIQALEQQDFDLLPPRTFVRGFIRNYARLLNIDADTVLEALPPDDPQVLSPAAFSIKKPTRTMPVLPSYDKKPSAFWKGLSVVLILAVIVGVIYSWPHLTALFPEHQPKQAATETVMPPVIDENHPSVSPSESGNSAVENDAAEKSQTLTPVIAPLPESPADSTAAPEAPKLASPASAAPGNTDLALIFSGDSWVEVRDKSDKVIYSALAKGGSEKSLSGEPPFSLVLGNSSAVAVTWRGAPVDLSSQSKQGVARLTLP